MKRLPLTNGALMHHGAILWHHRQATTNPMFRAMAEVEAVCDAMKAKACRAFHKGNNAELGRLREVSRGMA